MKRTLILAAALAFAVGAMATPKPEPPSPPAPAPAKAKQTTRQQQRVDQRTEQRVDQRSELAADQTSQQSVTGDRSHYSSWSLAITPMATVPQMAPIQGCAAKITQDSWGVGGGLVASAAGGKTDPDNCTIIELRNAYAGMCLYGSAKQLQDKLAVKLLPDFVPSAIAYQDLDPRLCAELKATPVTPPPPPGEPAKPAGGLYSLADRETPPGAPAAAASAAAAPAACAAQAQAAKPASGPARPRRGGRGCVD
jgi:hypothetical protein